MSYATLMVYVDGEAASEQRTYLAASLANKFNSTLVGFSALAMRTPLAVEGGVIAQAIEAEDREINRTLLERERWFRQIAGKIHQKLEWRSTIGFPTESLVREARSADLLLIGRGRPGDAYNSLDLAGAVLNAGRPALVVPQGIASLQAKHVVIGWKDTREARRAIPDALPFLHEADSIAIIEVHEPGETEAARKRIDDVAKYLERHRIKAGPIVMIRRKGSDAEQLLQAARDAGADLLVTGAYGHTRLGEWFFGGVTRELLAASPICCLMSH